jgi:1-acyl-sn-glycerol-3-phosphate acyltransferase
MLIKILKALFRALFWSLTRTQVHGAENIPPQGECILVANHLGILDPPLVYVFLDREDITGLVAKKYQSNPFTRGLVNLVGGIWLNRGEVDTRAFREAVEYLNRGGMIGISPEGTRSPTQALIHAKTGVAYLADKTRAPILPAGITGTERAFSMLMRLRRPRLIVRFGSPFTLPPVNRSTRNEDLKRNTDEIMCRIAALLPHEYRGVYAEHPRLTELLDN